MRPSPSFHSRLSPRQSARIKSDSATIHMNATFEELTRAIEQEAKKWPEVLRRMTHPGVGPLTVSVLQVRRTHRNSHAERFR